MSETTTTATATPAASATSAQASSPSPSTASQSSGQGASQAGKTAAMPVNRPTFGDPNGTQGAQPASETTSTPKELGDGDMDALVTVKINGKVEKMPVRELVKLQQLEKASHEKMRQAAEVQRRAQEILQSDLDAFAKMKGVDLDALAEERLAKKFELMQMTPEQRELHQLRQEREQMQKMEMSSKQEIINQIKEFNPEIPPGAENATKEQLMGYLNHVQQQYKATQTALEKEIVDAWKESGLPKHKYFGALMSFHMMNHQKRTGEALQASEAAAKVKNEFGGHVREILGSMDAQAIHEFLGKDLLSKLREYDVQRVTSQASTAQPQKSPGQQPASEPKKYLNQMEWRKAMGIS